MKQLISFRHVMAILVTLLFTSCSTGSFSTVSSYLSSAIITGTSYVFEKHGGMSREEAQQNAIGFYDMFGANEAEKSRAETWMQRSSEWQEAGDNYQKRKVLYNIALDNMSFDNPRMDSLLRGGYDAVGFLSDYLKANNSDERLEVINKKGMAFNDTWNMASKIRIDNHNAAVQRRIEERLEMEKQLKNIRGGSFSNEDVSNGTSFIIATIQSNELTDGEKEEFLGLLGLKQSPQEIINIVEPILNGNNDDGSKRQKEAEERRVAEERRLAEQRAAEERRSALQTLDSMIIDGFALDVTILSDEQKIELDKAANILNKYDDVNVFLTGHTCYIGYRNINQRKGMKRAEAAKDYLMSKGISENRITIDSKGEDEPLVPNNSRENLRRNRRVEIQIIK